MLDRIDVPRAVLRQQFSRVCEEVTCEINPVSGGFSGAGVFRVDSPDASFCLRRWPVHQTFPRRVLAIHELLALAHENGSTVVPVPLRSTAGSTLTEVGEAFWQLEPWKPGVADFLSMPIDGRLKSAMTQLGQFHHAVRAWTPSVDLQKWFQPATFTPSPTVEQRLRMIESHDKSILDLSAALAQESDSRFREVGSRIVLLFQAAKDSVKRDLNAVAEIKVPQQPCIRDLWHDHLLFRGDELTGMVDFGAMATDSVTCDLSRLLGSLFGDDFFAWQQAIDHYETVRPLSESEHRLLRPLDRSSVLLSGMTWLKRRYVLRNTPEQLSAVCDRMETIVSRLTVLAETFSI
jgi:hypothetical protein